ncbi:Similar to SDR39U1: Epimerase family protein SDR39U1 (Bos taurus) [Cotesia congregata]|uniref:Similar to SDR39U1: Epimerase family protein SDR39U1 (Bos taurus) n=1 Tax=Cotesia congregata TaxID=51543 RepID=A0A8J2MM93_COTCN|nr:Similar to SDR39U1: Epimerase family protein SDR39U1 (Bos taurus) [Cotesia congregata]
MIRHVVIGGGTGFIGRALAFSLRNEGHTVSILSRNTTGPEYISWETLSIKGLPEDTTDVINVSGQNILDPMKRWNEEFKNDVWNSRVRTTKLLANAVNKKSDVKSFLTISGVAYYKPDDKLTHAWEKAAELSPSSSCRQITIRSGVVLGRYGGMIQQIIMPFFLGLGGPIGSGKQIMPWIHISDLVDLFRFAIEEEKVKGVLNGVAPQIITNKEFARAFARAMWRPAFLPLPEFAVNLIFSSERARIMTEGQKVIPKRVLEYGFEYSFPQIDEACQQFADIAYPHSY